MTDTPPVKRHTLVTGGAGFIGSQAVAELLDRGEAVSVLDNLSTGHAENLVGTGDQCRLMQGDLADFETVKAAMEGVSHVLHLGALASVPRSIANPLETNRSNVLGTLNVLEAARVSGVQRLVFASSSAVYGDAGKGPKAETLVPSPLSPYAASKLAGEAYCRAYRRSMDIETVVLRFFNVYGPRQDPNSQYAAVIPRFIRAMTQGERPVIYGDGMHARDFTYVSDVVRGVVLARDTDGIAGGTFNLATSSSHTLLELVDLINGVLGTELAPVHSDPRPGDIRYSLADISAANSWGYSPAIDFKDGIEKTVEFFSG